MLEIFIDKQEKQEKVALVENGNLVEYYEEDENICMDYFACSRIDSVYGLVDSTTQDRGVKG